MASRNAMQVSNPFEGVFDGWKEDLVEGFQELVVGGTETALENVNEIVEAMILLVITPPLPDGAAVYVDGHDGGGFFSNYWDQIIELNEALTEIAIALFGLFFLIYLIGLGVGVVNQTDMAQSFFIMTIGFVLLVNNAEILNLAWALIYAISDAIISFPIGDSNTGTSIAGGLTAGSTIAGGAAAGLAMKFGLSIVLIPIIILVVFFAVTLMFVQIIAVTGYAAFPFIIGLWLVGTMFESVQGYTNKINGFFIPAMYASIPLAMVFKVASVFVGSGFETQEGASEFLGSVALSLFGPIFTLGAILIGVFIVLKNFQAGAAVIGGVSTAVVAGATVGVAAATGGVGAAAKGFAMRGTKGAAGNVAANAMGGSGTGASADFYQDAPEMGAESSESSSGVLGGLADFGKGVDQKIAGGATSTLESAGQSVSERMPNSIVNTEDSSPSALVDRITPEGQGVLGSNDVVTDPQAGLEQMNENKDRIATNIETGAVEVDDAAEAMIDAQVDQMGLEGSDAEVLKEFQMERLGALKDTEHPFKSGTQTDAEAFNEWSATSFSEDELANMGLSGTLNGGKATSGQGVVSSLDSQLENKASRQEFRANPMSGLTSENKNDYGAEYVSIGSAVDGNEKSERLQYSTDAISAQQYSSNTPKFRMEGRENGMVEYGFDPDIIPDDVASDHPLLDAEQTGDGTFVMNADDFAQNMDIIPFGEIEAVADRESSILLENSVKDTERGVQESLRQAIDLESAEAATLDNLLEGRLSLSDLFDGNMGSATDNITFARDDHTSPSVDAPGKVTDSKPPIREVDAVEASDDPYKGPLDQNLVDRIDTAETTAASYIGNDDVVEQTRQAFERQNRTPPSESEIVHGTDSVDMMKEEKIMREQQEKWQQKADSDNERRHRSRMNALQKGAIRSFSK